MKIAVVGAGRIGGTLGPKWARAGHAVVFGVRDRQSSKTQSALAAGSGAQVDTLAAAVAFGEIVFLAVPGSAAEPLIMAHADALNGKIILDATNNVGAAEMLTP